MPKLDYKLSKILYIIPGFVFLWLFIGSISMLFRIRIVLFTIESGFFLEAVKEFKANSTIVPILFIAIFIFYLFLGFYFFSEKYRNKTHASAAIGGLSISIILFIFAFWKLIVLFPLFFLEPFILIGLLIVSYRLIPWEEALRLKISQRLTEVDIIINDYLKIIGNGEVQKDLQFRIFDELKKFQDEQKKIRTRIESNKANIKMADLNSERLLSLLKSLKSIDTEENIIDIDKKMIMDDIRKYMNAFKDDQIIDRIMQHYLKKELMSFWNDNKKDIIKADYER